LSLPLAPKGAIVTAVLEAQDLKQHYVVSRGFAAKPAVLKALDGVSLSLAAGQTLAVVGESGCGKSTLARLLAMIEAPTAGTLRIVETEVVGASTATLKALRPRVQMVFQNPYGSLNPRQKIGHALEEPLLVNHRFSAAERQSKARDIMQLVGLRPEHYDRYPHMFSGGQRQRIAIARALMLEPDILVLDEPVSALDLSIQAQILNLLAELQDRLKLAYVFISHDLSVVRHIADHIMVMYLGRIVEYGSRDAVFKHPTHPYTRALLSATPIADPNRQQDRIVLKGELPSPLAPPSGCTFRTRCPIAVEACALHAPLLHTKNFHSVACDQVGFDVIS
jgi:dipeptide transport system ATP-binding protein